jgi:tRNA dimethylallyltransferase
VVGGTGLYFKALLGGLADIPPVPDVVRAEVQKLYDQLGGKGFHLMLTKLDIESATRLAKNDRQRLIRAYEVALHTGKPIGYWQKEGPAIRDQGSGGKIYLPGCRPLNVTPYLLRPPREQLYAACDRRFEKMIERGVVEEVKQFLKRGLDPDLPAMKTFGLREIAAYLKGEATLEQAIVKAQQATRNYAKRQMTWFRNQWKV